MIDLNSSGLNLYFDESGKKLVLTDEGEKKEFKPNLRQLGEMRDLFFNNKIEQNDDAILYYMFRNVCKKTNEKAIKKSKLRYDITIIPPNVLGGEYVKTAGHYHPIIKNNLSYSEVYHVLDGQGLFLLQKKQDFAGNKIYKSIFILGKAGDLIYIPPNYGHITINISGSTLYMANWVSSVFKSDYKEIKGNKGGLFYILKKDTAGFKMEKNKNYGEYKNKCIFASAKKPNFFGFDNNVPMYEFIKEPEKLLFLNEPDVLDEDYK